MSGPDVSVEVTMPPGSVIITPAQMYAELRSMGGKVDNLIAVIDPALTTIRQDVADHETRIRSIEKRIWVVGGAASALGGAAGYLLPLIGH